MESFEKLNEKTIEEIERIVRSAGEIMLSADRTSLAVSQKEGTANFVTEYDVRVQKYLEGELLSLMGECSFLAEEDGESQNEIGEGYTFVIDPIDGTTNFMLDRHTSVISVGLLYEGEPVFGAVYDPYRNRYFWGLRGKGAYCNGERIHVSDRPASRAVIGFGTSPYNSDTLSGKVGRLATGILESFADLRRLGAAALEGCAVACGELDGYCEHVLSPWDYAAIVTIISEAGGVVSDFEGAPLKFYGTPSTLFASSVTYEKLLQVAKDSLKQ